MDENIFETKEYKSILRQIGILNTVQQAYKAKEGKINQVKDYVRQIYCLANKLSKKRELTFVDCACGKSYVSFAASYVLKNVYGMNIKFICIDSNSKLIESCRETAKKLGFDNMEFVCEDISCARIDMKPDIVYCLHACDKATDMAIALGIRSCARNILAVSCCQHSVENQLARHPLTQITRHSIYKERLADMLSDSMRTLILESRGYKVNLFEFTPVSSTPKNIMLRAVKTGSISDEKKASCLEAYNKLKQTFHSRPNLSYYLKTD